jgi:hypothetical protein
MRKLVAELLRSFKNKVSTKVNSLPLAKSEKEPGNTMATKNQRTHNIWIIDITRIVETMKAKRNCLGNAFQD